MQRVDGHYLYQLGLQLHPLSELQDASGSTPTTLLEAYFPLVIAEAALDGFLHQSIFGPRFCRDSGENLLSSIRQLKDKINEMKVFDSPVERGDLFGIKHWLGTFETNLAAEMAQMNLYIVQKKGAYDTTDLIFNGASLMPSDLHAKVPEAVKDVAEATKSLAFELFTAVGFHIHRANEAVLHRYYDVVTNGAKRPKTRNIGDYLNELDKLKAGDERVKAALRDLKDLHRNPLIHPDQSIESADDAIDLLSAVRAVVGQMLRAIPAPSPLEGYPVIKVEKLEPKTEAPAS
jgi:hypothetical protein